MTDTASIDLEAPITEAVRSFLLQDRGTDYWISEDEGIRSICALLARLLAVLLSKEDEWSSYAWVDSISPCTADQDSPNSLLLTGVVIWMGDNSKEYKEPFCARLQVFETSQTPLSYSLHFADADKGLGTCPYGSSHDFPYVPVERWMFTFVFGE
jgi:hypothetical protein